MYFGEIGKRYELTLKLVKQFTFVSHFSYYGEDNYINTFEDAEGNVYVWKTNKLMGIDTTNKRGDMVLDAVRVNDTVTVKATVKDHSEYKGTQQTVLSRVTVMKIEHAATKEELDEQKREEQLASLSDDDFVWTMPYKQYKEHYADCETLAGSYDKNNVSIAVIIRTGRLVPSGVRGQHFHGYEFQIDNGFSCFRAVSKENAERRCRKEFPDAKKIELRKIYW